MQIIYYPDQVPSEGRYAATIGFFDGVHSGHRFVIRQLSALAERNSLLSMVITFEHHPRQVVQQGWQPQLLTTLDEKAELLRETGIDVLVVLRFDRSMAALTAREFMQRVLKDALHVDCLLTGYDNRFGSDRSAGFDDYVAYGRELGIVVTRSDAVDMRDGNRICSSLVRRLVSEGSMELAAEALGRAYSLSGMVVHGEAVGRQLGFPTANVLPESAERLVPAAGVYAVKVMIAGDGRVYMGMMNIGTRPTFGEHEATLEVNIFDFIGEIYGRRITVELISRLRSEQRFGSREALIRQMKLDRERALSCFLGKGV